MKKLFSVIQIQCLALSLRLTALIWILNFCVIQIIAFFQGRINLSLAEKASFPPFNGYLLDVLIIGPIIEELVFRKWIINFVQPRLRAEFACILSAIIFAAAHAFDVVHFSMVDVELTNFMGQITAGFIYAIIYVRTQRIIYSIVAHMFFNLIVLMSKSQIYIHSNTLSYFPHLFIGIVTAIYLALEVQRTFFFRQAKP